MSGYKIELNWEMVDEIVVGQLRSTWETLKRDLGAGNHVFVYDDPVADDAEIQKRMDALELILKWYATPEQLKDMGLGDD
jgi:hypothetical protein